MKILLTYTSLTGNTEKVALAIKAAIRTEVTFCRMEDAPPPDGFDAVIVGFWIDKGLPCGAAINYIKKIKGKKAAFFGTMGAHPSSEYAGKCLVGIRELFSQNTIVCEFICQGKIDEKLIEFFKTLPQSHHHAITEESIQKYRQASSHPDEADLERAGQTFREAFENLSGTK